MIEHPDFDEPKRLDEPLAPDEGDNKALAVNTNDGTVTYDVAFALVWAVGDEVLNVNEAHAYASCTDCVAVAVAFQVVLIMDDAQVVVPQNLAVAANYDCHSCITAAVASQLVLSIPGEPGEEQLLQLAGVWTRLLDFARNITAYSLTEITDQLDGFKEEITSGIGANGSQRTQARTSSSGSDWRTTRRGVRRGPKSSSSLVSVVLTAGSGPVSMAESGLAASFGSVAGAAPALGWPGIGGRTAAERVRLHHRQQLVEPLQRHRLADEVQRAQPQTLARLRLGRHARDRHDG